MRQPKFGFVVEKKGETGSLFRQVHGNTVIEIDDANHRARLLNDPPEADGAWTASANVELHVFTADCLPVLIHAPDGKRAAVHSGWRGAMGGIVAKAASLLGADARVIFGPAILSCCFEVRQDFVAAFREAGRRIDPYLTNKDGKFFCDLPAFVANEELGRSLSDIDTSSLRCTYCSSPQLPSYRRDGNTEIRLRTWLTD